jgi:hypothetical protein
MKPYEKPMIQYFDLRVEERIAAPSCTSTGRCQVITWESPSANGLPIEWE